MKWNLDESKSQLLAAIASYNYGEVEALCWALIDYTNKQIKPYDVDCAVNMVCALQKKRYFELASRVANAFILSGVDSFELRKQYAQSLIDQGHLSAAIAYLESLLGDLKKNISQSGGGAGPADPLTMVRKEYTEVRGLIGRAHKQVFVDFNSDSPQSRGALTKALEAYLAPYIEDGKVNYWHGINYVALLAMAVADDIVIDGVPDPQQEVERIAKDILSYVQSRWDNCEASMWDSGTAMEACVALSRCNEAREWLERYVREPRADAFELGSTLRQLEEVWQLSAIEEPGASLLPVLQAELLLREGGGFIVSPDKLKRIELSQQTDLQHERVFGEARYHSYSFMQKAVKCAHRVARIEHEPGKGFGTGFVIKGSELHVSFGNIPVLLTNAHVISDDVNSHKSLHPEDAIVTFELAADKKEYGLKKVLWSSSPERLDATILQFDDSGPELGHPFPLTTRLPLTDGKQRVYIIGHPKGGGISFSMQDNILLDHEAPYLHYRAPTEGGSSGSPVFNAQWKLIGIHHAGGDNLNRLNKKKGVYQANEGIWIQSIIMKLKEDLG